MPLAFHARKSITFDRGSEFIDGQHLQVEVGTQTWFYAGVDARRRRLRKAAG